MSTPLQMSQQQSIIAINGAISEAQFHDLVVRDLLLEASEKDEDILFSSLEVMKAWVAELSLLNLRQHMLIVQSYVDLRIRKEQFFASAGKADQAKRYWLIEEVRCRERIRNQESRRFVIQARLKRIKVHVQKKLDEQKMSTAPVIAQSYQHGWNQAIASMSKLLHADMTIPDIFQICQEYGQELAVWAEDHPEQAKPSFDRGQQDHTKACYVDQIQQGKECLCWEDIANAYAADDGSAGTAKWT